MTITNNRAALVWSIVVSFALVVAVFTGITVYRGVPGGHSPLFFSFVLLLFWAAAVASATQAVRTPLVRVKVEGTGTVLVEERYPFRRTQRRFRRIELHRAEVRETTDSDGDPYFTAVLVTTNGGLFTLHESHDRSQCAAICDRFNEAAGLAPPQHR